MDFLDIQSPQVFRGIFQLPLVEANQLQLQMKKYARVDTGAHRTLSETQRRGLIRLREGVKQLQITLDDGSEIESNSQLIRYILELVGNYQLQ